MANRKISELQSRTPALSDLMLVGDPSSGYSYKCTVTALATIIETDIADGYVTIGTTQTISGAKTFSNNLTLTSVANATTTQTKFLTLNASNVVNYRTGAEVLADIGGQGTITLTTTGTSGAATLVGSTLNIPQYQSVLTNPVTGTGTTNYVTKWTSSSAVGNSQIIDNGTAIGIGTAPSNAYLLSVAGIYRGVGVGNAARIELYDTQSGGATFYISPQESLGVTSLGTYGAFPILFVTNSAERIRISSAGDVTISTIANATIDTDKFLVSDSGVIKYRTGAEVLSDIGGASSSSISGTTNYIPKFTSSSAIGNSAITDNGSITTSLQDFYVSKGNAIMSITSTNTGGFSVLRLQSSGISDLWFGRESSTSSIFGLTPSSSVIYSEGAHPFITFVNGSERMRLDASGNLGINTSSPAAKLDVVGSSGIRVNEDGAGTKVITIRSNFAGVDPAINVVTNNSLLFLTNNTERMRLDASGNLGLGVTPSAWTVFNPVLQVKTGSLGSSGTANFRMFANTFYDGAYKYIGTGTATQYEQDGYHAWYTAPSGTAGNAISFTQAMTLFSTGNLAVGGTSDNGSRLNVTGAATFSSSVTAQQGVNVGANALGTDRMFQISGTAFTSGATQFGIVNNPTMTTPTTIYGYYGGVTVTSATNGYGIYISSAAGTITNKFGIYQEGSGDKNYFAGNVGIGTTSPNSVLEVAGTIGTAKIASSSTTAGNYPYLDFNHAGNDAFRIGGGDGLRFLSSATTERMRITSGGNVGIGVTSPGAKLEVNGAIKTAAPSGGTAKPIKFGEIVTLGGSNTQGVRVEIDGTVYYLVTGYLP